MTYQIIRQSIPEIQDYYFNGRFHEQPKGYKTLEAAKKTLARLISGYPRYEALLRIEEK